MTIRTRLLSLAVLFPLTVIVPACNDDGHDDDDGHGHDHDETEVITRVTLSFAPQGGGSPVSASFSDPDGPGGMSGTSEPITLDAMETYSVTVTFANELENPPEDVTVEIREDDDEHQVFFYGTALDASLLTHEYADQDAGGLPVGLTNTIVAADPGTGELRVRLQHLPPLNDQPQKTAGLADRFPDIPGDVDADVAFPVTVQ